MKKKHFLVTAMLLFSVALLSSCGAKKDDDYDFDKDEDRVEEVKADVVTEEVATNDVAVAVSEDELLDNLSYGDYSFTSARGDLCFSEGVSWVDSVSVYTGNTPTPTLVNKDMKILYVCDPKIINFEYSSFVSQVWPVKDGLGILSVGSGSVIYNSDSSTEAFGFVFVDASGKELYSNTDQGTCFFSRADDGAMFMLQQQSGFSEDGCHLCKISKSGEITDIVTLCDNVKSSIKNNMKGYALSNGAYIFTHEGDSAFIYYVDPAKKVQCVIDGRYLDNINDQLLIQNNISADGVFKLSVDNLASIAESNNTKSLVSDDFDDSITTFGTNCYGTYSKETQTFNFIFLADNTVAYAADADGNKLYDYPQNQYSYISPCVDGYQVAFAIGADGNTYLITFDDKGNPQNDPTKLFDGAFTYYNFSSYYSKNHYSFINFNSSLYIINPDGNLIYGCGNINNITELADQNFNFVLPSNYENNILSISENYFGETGSSIIDLRTGEFLR